MKSLVDWSLFYLNIEYWNKPQTEFMKTKQVQTHSMLKTDKLVQTTMTLKEDYVNGDFFLLSANT